MILCIQQAPLLCALTMPAAENSDSMLEAADRQAGLAPAPLHGHSPLEKVSLLPAPSSALCVRNFQGASEGSAQPRRLTHARFLPLETPVSCVQELQLQACSQNSMTVPRALSRDAGTRGMR